MSLMKKASISLVVLMVLLVLGVLLFSSAIFRAGLNAALKDVRETYGVDVSYSTASLSLGGELAIEDLAAVDLNTKTSFASVKKIDVEVALGSLLSDPIQVTHVLLQSPVITYFPGIGEVFRSPETVTLDGNPLPDIQAAEKKSSGKKSKSRGVAIKKGAVKDGKVQVKTEAAEPKEVVSKVEASVTDFSNVTPFAFDLSAELSGESRGILGLKGNVNPASLDGQVALSFDGVEIKDKTTPWPRTDGTLSIAVEKNLSHILSTAKINMAGPPPYVPAELTAGTPFEINWKLDSNIENQGQGRMDLRSLELAVHGLKGGPQALTGSGAYDPASAQGNLVVEAKEISLPLFNIFIEPALQMRVLSGKGSLSGKISREGADKPFAVNADLSLGGLALNDLSGKSSNLKFQDINLTTKATFSPEKDSLDISDLSAQFDDIRLAVRGRILGLQDAKKREVDLVVQNENLDLGRIVPLAAPQFSEQGSLSGVAGVNISIKGQTASSKFPILNGNLDLKGVTFVPKTKPEMKVGVKGGIAFDADTVSGDDLDLTLAEVPGKLTFKVEKYNEPKKDLSVSFKGLAIEPLVNIYKPEMAGLLKGNISGDVLTTLGQQSRPDALEINYTIEKGMMLTRHPVPKAIVDLVGWDWLKNGFVLTNARGKIIQDERGYHLDPLLFMGEKGGFAIKGWIGFDNKLTATARVNVAKGSVDEVPSVIRSALRAKEGSEFAYLDIPMGGTVQRPVPKIDLQTAVETGLDVLQSKLQEKLDKKGKGSQGDLIQGVGDLLRGGSSSGSSSAGEGGSQPPSSDPHKAVGDLLEGFLKKR